MDKKIKAAYKLLFSEFDLPHDWVAEGMEFNPRTKTVHLEFSHERGVDTGSIFNPVKDSIKIKGKNYPVYSIFKRKYIEDDIRDGNPLLYAFKNYVQEGKGKDATLVLKNPNDWRLEWKEGDKMKLLRNFIEICSKIDRKYDTIVMAPSSNILNEKFLYYLSKMLDSDNVIKDYFRKLDCESVLELYDYESLEKDLRNEGFLDAGIDNIVSLVEANFAKMNRENDGVFSYKYLDVVKGTRVDLRSYVTKSMEFREFQELRYADKINGRDILILDDTISRGFTVSEMVKAIISTYTPKSVTIVTLFSMLKR